MKKINLIFSFILLCFLVKAQNDSITLIPEYDIYLEEGSMTDSVEFYMYFSESLVKNIYQCESVGSPVNIIYILNDRILGFRPDNEIGSSLVFDVEYLDMIESVNIIYKTCFGDFIITPIISEVCTGKITFNNLSWLIITNLK